MFDINSRYYQLEDKFLTTEDGSLIAYKKRRFLPLFRRNKSTVTQTRFIEGDRLDLIAARTLGDPLSFWQIADANIVMHPEQLTEKAGDFIDIPLIPLQITPDLEG